jgi:hypothetical protein
MLVVWTFLHFKKNILYSIQPPGTGPNLLFPAEKTVIINSLYSEIISQMVFTVWNNDPDLEVEGQIRFKFPDPRLQK